MKTIEFNKIEDALDYFTKNIQIGDDMTFTMEQFIECALSLVGTTWDGNPGKLDNFCSIQSENCIELYNKRETLKITDERLTGFINQYCEWRTKEPDYFTCNGKQIARLFQLRHMEE